MKNTIVNFFLAFIVCVAVAAIILSGIYIEQSHSQPKTNEFNTTK